MFANTRKFTICANRLACKNVSRVDERAKNINGAWAGVRKLHTTPLRLNYAAAATLPLPNNIDPAETTRFSPNRARDISGTVILSQHAQTVAVPRIDIIAENSPNSMVSSDNPINFGQQDPHVQSYDCFGAVSLNSAMQSNVPTPFGGMHKFSHLNMPGGQWSQVEKFMSHNLHSTHYITLRQDTRSGWVAYDQDATVGKEECTTTAATRTTTTAASSMVTSITTVNGSSTLVQGKRGYSTNTSNSQVETGNASKALSKKEQLKRAFKDYGATVVVFHVAISLLSLGGCYLLVAGGVDVMALLDRIGLASANAIAANASTFVIAYAIHKVFAPVRISITLGATPFIVRYMRSKGYLKPPKTT